MVERSTVIDFAFKQSTGVDIRTVVELLSKKGITIEQIDNIGSKFNGIIKEEVEKTDFDDNIKVLFHIYLTYIVFKISVRAFNRWAEDEAKELGLSSKKFTDIMYHL